MKTTIFKKCLLIALCFAMLIGAMPLTAFAVDFKDSADGYYTVVSKTDYTLAPGITESEIVLNNASGSRRQVNHVVEIDVSNPYTKVMPSIRGMAEGLNAKEYGVQVMSEQAKYAEEHGYGNVVAAMNTTLHWYDTDYYTQHPELIGEPLGYLIMDGVEYANSQNRYFGACTCLVINYDEKDGVARPADIPKTQIRQTWDAITGWEEQVIPANFHPLLEDGKNIYLPNDPTEPAPRSFMGIKEDGTIVLVMNEGRQAPYSTGFNCYEMGEFMLSLGCVYAINCDGGGSSTFLSERPGEELKLHCSPSDGSERPTTSGVLVISTAPAAGEFKQARISSEHDYYTPGSTVVFSAVGTDYDGVAADIPSDAVWQLADPSFGAIEKGVFTSNGKCGDVTVQMTVGGEVVGEDTIHIVAPDTLSFASTDMVIPYGTKVSLGLTASYNGNHVAFSSSDITVTSDNHELGEADGLYFAAAQQGATDATAQLTATLGDVSASATVRLGRGSDVVYTFENGTDEETEAQKLSGFAVSASKDGVQSALHVVNRSDGQVKNGDYALALDCDFTQLTDTDKQEICLTFPAIACGDATAVGFWLYAPAEARYAQLIFGNSGETVSLCEGWQYVTVTPTGAEFDRVSVILDDQTYASAEYADAVNINSTFTLYIDDITLDYSEAVEDRQAPVFSEPTVTDPDSGVSQIMQGQVLTSNAPSFEVLLSENTMYPNATGIDPTSVKVFVDGVEVQSTYHGGKITVSSVTLADGVHTVTFRAEDKKGNVASVEQSVCICANAAIPTVKVVPRDAEADRLPIGSVYWLDVIATDIAKTDTVSLVLDLNNASSWETDGITVASGFAVDYAVKDPDNQLTLSLKRVTDSSVAGEEILASIPVRTWVSTASKTPSALVANGVIWAQSVGIRLEKGEWTPVDAYTASALCAFGMSDVCVDTELFFNAVSSAYVDGAQEWIDACVTAGIGFHEHSEQALADKAATCTEYGYTGRTFCDGCQSVVQWGTATAADGHTFAVVGNTLACECGDVLTDAGLQTVSGKTYYVSNGTLMSGWISIGDAWYYFDPATYAGLHGQQYADSTIRFTFENGRLVSGAWTRNNNGYRYWYGPGYYKDVSPEKTSCRPYEIDGKTYLFNRDGYMQTGMVRFYDSGIFVYYDCGTDGAATLCTGVYGDYYYLDGIRLNAYQLVQDANGNFYFINDGHKIARNCEITLTARFVSGKTFADGTAVTAGKYAFDADGKMIVKNGVYGDYFYRGNVLQKAYQLIKYEGDYYFIDKGNKVSKNTTVHLTSQFTTQYGLAVGKYDFDENGKMIIKNGVHGEYFYLGNVLQKAYQLIKYEGDYYFIDKGNKVSKNTTVYLTAQFASQYGLPVGKYDFDENGKLIIKNGVYGDYFYLGNVLQRAYQLIEFEGDYYFINDGNKVTKSKSVHLNAQFTAQYGLAVGKYDFDENGKMIMRSGPYGDYFYRDGVMQKAYRLVEYEGYYYFIDKGDKLAKNTTVYLTAQFTAQYGLAVGKYAFDADGKMIVKHGVVGDYFYLNGTLQRAYQLVEFEGDYYFINDGNKVTKNATVHLNARFVSQYGFAVGKYTFDENGKMLYNHGVVGDSLYIKGTLQKAYRLQEFEGAYYFVDKGNKVAKNTSVYLSEQFVKGVVLADGTQLEVGRYYFDADGKMILN